MRQRNIFNLWDSYKPSRVKSLFNPALMAMKGTREDSQGECIQWPLNAEE